MTSPRIAEPEAWCTLGTHYLYRKPWLTMRQDTVKLPNGRVIDDYYIWEYPPWVNVLAVTRERKFVLIRQYRHGIGKVFYELPAGVHDREGESLLDSAKRELQEETGYGGGSWSALQELSANPALQNNITSTWLAEGVELLGTQQLDATEEISVHLVTLEELRAIALDGGMMQSLHVAPVLKYLLTREH
jgi:8-oxo-dGTP pyrophosphatase MutT (NUDIX family)